MKKMEEMEAICEVIHLYAHVSKKHVICLEISYANSVSCSPVLKSSFKGFSTLC